MDEYTLDDPPRLENAVLIAAFGGWNDAGDVATSAARWLIGHFNARRFASLDQEEFYDFTETRPRVSVDNRGVRHISWPTNEWFHLTDVLSERPVLVFIGAEPQLRWRRYATAFLDLAEQTGVTTVVVLGAFLQDVPHTRPPKLSGAANERRWRQRLAKAGIAQSNYEGPTGIVSVIQDGCRQRGGSSVSLWGAVPHYISAHPNPRVMFATLQAVSTLLDMPLDLGTVEEEAKAFEQRVDSALKSNPEVAAIVRALEQQADLQDTPALPSVPESPLPSGADLVEELERFLRSRQKDQPGE